MGLEAARLPVLELSNLLALRLERGIGGRDARAAAIDAARIEGVYRRIGAGVGSTDRAREYELRSGLESRSSKKDDLATLAALALLGAGGILDMRSTVVRSGTPRFNLCPWWL